MPLLWCSFADPTKTKGFLGVIITEAADIRAAVGKCDKLGINPGGELLTQVLPTDCDEAKYPRDVLLCDADLRGLSGQAPKKLKDSPRLVKQYQKLKCSGPGPGHSQWN